MPEVIPVGTVQHLLELCALHPGLAIVVVRPIVRQFGPDRIQQGQQRGEALATVACNESLWPHLGATLPTCTERRPTMESPRVVADPDILGGTPVFVGTRVPVRVLFEHLEAGDSLEVFLQDFPSVSRTLAVQVLEDARAALLPDAHPA